MDDFMSFERVEEFIPEDKRCKCNKKDCIVSCVKLIIAIVFDRHDEIKFTFSFLFRLQGAGKNMMRFRRRPNVCFISKGHVC